MCHINLSGTKRSSKLIVNYLPTNNSGLLARNDAKAALYLSRLGP
ncbi:hypothetical protein HDF15_002819 [Granulicella mallensis]|uniref:Uncharacterized protein n=1 Tax=Granulicella mallensis TaxID=940614 RepID=A0A7W7ZQV5_9BACT|nr:hypothetical protein [Granulicella mallensis]